MKVFISYSRADGKFVEKLIKDLRANNIVVCYDGDFTPGDRIPSAVAKAIEVATVFIPVVSHNSVHDSKWCSNELDNWLAKTLDKESPSGIYKTIPVVIEKDCKLPGQIAHIISIDFYTRYKSAFAKLIEAINKPAGKIPEASASLEKTSSFNSHIYVYNYQKSRQTEQEDSPYLLRKLEPDDGDFFNRRNIYLKTRGEILDQINKMSSFITLQGESGSGKSSLVLGGVIPELSKQSNWIFVYFQITDNPFSDFAKALVSIKNDLKGDLDKRDVIELNTLAAELKGEEGEECLNRILKDILDTKEYTSPRILFIADQLESLYSKCSSEIRSDFLSKLTSCIKQANQEQFNQIILLATFDQTNIVTEGIKADQDYKDFIQKTSIVEMERLNDSTLEELIITPAKQKGITIEKELAKLIIEELGSNKNDLFLLGAILDNLWEEAKSSNRNVVMTELYQIYQKERNGNALDYFANKSFKNLGDESEKDASKELFLSMIYAIDNNQRIITKSKTIESEKYKNIVNKLSRVIKTTSSDKNNKKIEIEFAHKKIAENWDMLRKWVNEEKKNLEIARNLEANARLWHENYNGLWGFPLPKDWSYLHTGRRLEEDNVFFKKYSFFLDEDALVESFLNRSRFIYFIFSAFSIIISCLGIVLILFLISEILSIDKNNKTREIENRISYGEKILLDHSNFNKSHGTKKYSENTEASFFEAREFFLHSRNSNKDDPETLIYLNNARASEWAKKYNKEPYSIAVSIPAGGNKVVALEILRGVAQAQNDLNKGCLDSSRKKFKVNCDSGINGKPLRIMIFNDDNKKETAVDLAKYLVNEKKDIVAVIGHNASEASSKAAMEYQKGKLVMISPTSFALDFEELDNKLKDRKINNYIFAVTYSHEALIEKIISKIKTEPKEKNQIPKKILLCYDDSSFDQKAFAKSFEEKEEVKVVPHSDNSNVKPPCDFSNPDIKLTEELKGLIKNNGIDYIFLASHVNRIGDSISVLRKISDFENLDTNDISFFSSPTLYTNQTLALGGKFDTKLWITVPWFHPVDSEVTNSKSSEFFAAAKELWSDQSGIGITWRTAMAYDTTNVIIKGLKDSTIKNGETPRKALQQILASPSFMMSGATGLIKFFSNCSSKDESENGIKCSPGKRVKIESEPDPIALITIAEEKRDQVTIFEFKKQ